MLYVEKLLFFTNSLRLYCKKYLVLFYSYVFIIELCIIFIKLDYKSKEEVIKNSQKNTKFT